MMFAFKSHDAKRLGLCCNSYICINRGKHNTFTIYEDQRSVASVAAICYRLSSPWGTFFFVVSPISEGKVSRAWANESQAKVF